MLRRGDRVRIVRADSEYTGCRGTIADPEREDLTGLSVLGHQVAIDGENGVARPFLVEDLLPLRAARAGSSSSHQTTGTTIAETGTSARPSGPSDRNGGPRRN